MNEFTNELTKKADVVIPVMDVISGCFRLGSHVHCFGCHGTIDTLYDTILLLVGWFSLVYCNPNLVCSSVTGANGVSLTVVGELFVGA